MHFAILILVYCKELHQVEEYSAEMQPAALFTVQNSEEAHIGESRRAEMQRRLMPGDRSRLS